MTAEKPYKYKVRRSSWMYSDRAYDELKKWARNQVGYWWNHMSGPLETFVFWARPDELEEALLEIDGVAKYGVDGGSFDIAVDKSFKPLR